jgi:hypothetical protein
VHTHPQTTSVLSVPMHLQPPDVSYRCTRTCRVHMCLIGAHAPAEYIVSYRCTRTCRVYMCLIGAHAPAEYICVLSVNTHLQISLLPTYICSQVIYLTKFSADQCIIKRHNVRGGSSILIYGNILKFAWSD